jgi:signal transduction histidine kinase
MERLKASILLSFRAKVLVPVVGVMVLLVAVSMWFINRRITAQLQADAAQQVAVAEAAFRNSRELRADNLFLRYHNMVNEPRLKTLAGKPDRGTFSVTLKDLVTEKVADVITAATKTGEFVALETDDVLLDKAAFQKSCEPSMAAALDGNVTVETIRNAERLFDVISLPVLASSNIVGAVSFGIENSMAQEFKRSTLNELTLIADGRVVASTLDNPAAHPALATKFTELSAIPLRKGSRKIAEIQLNGEHYLCAGGFLNAPNEEHHFGYLILSSYEEPLRALQATQRQILLISSLAILLGTAVVWFFVQRVTQPLRELRDSAEAVGKGDFSRRVEVRSPDECGELAHVFNQMILNLKNSREQLEMTVETLKTTQAQLIQSEKLSGIGEFVAGVAHELNNPLTSVMGFSELLKQANRDPKHQRHLELIHKNALRCQKIVQSLLSFARRHQPERKLVCLNALIEAALEILQYQLRTSGIEVTTTLDPDLPQAMVDPHQVQQVLVNIINNARQAIEGHKSNGAIKILTETRDEKVSVTIQDNGPGISDENLAKVFDPFFTTKEVGRGTGLGLSICYGIIKEHGGVITVRSEPDEGATFVIELPVTHDEAPSAKSEQKSELEQTRCYEGSGKRVLVIDDEEPILQMVREVLAGRGYDVDVACDGETGLHRLNQRQYDLALCDWKMPGMNGQQVYERMRTVNPQLSQRLIFITGDMVSDKTREFLDAEKKICLAKPFTLSEFSAAISKVMAA